MCLPDGAVSPAGGQQCNVAGADKCRAGDEGRVTKAVRLDLAGALT